MEKVSICPKDLEYIISKQRADLEKLQFNFGWFLIEELKDFSSRLSKSKARLCLSRWELEEIGRAAELIANLCHDYVSAKEVANE